MHEHSSIHDALTTEPVPPQKDRIVSSEKHLKVGGRVDAPGSHHATRGTKHFHFWEPERVKRDGRKKIRLFNVIHIVCLIISQLMVGAVNIIVLEFTLKTKDTHVILCGQAWHFFGVEAILCMTFTNAWLGVSRIIVRRIRYLHMILQIIGVILLVTGFVITVLAKDKKAYASHGILGIVTSVMSLVTVVAGPTSMVSPSNQNVKFFHICLALPSFVLSSVVLCTGFFTKNFKKTCGKKIVHILTFFVAFYTIYIIVSVITNGIIKIRRQMHRI